MAAPSLAFAFGLTPEAAVRWLEQRDVVVNWDWRSVARTVQAGSFSAAGVARVDVLIAIRDALTRALAEGTTYADFKAGLRERLTTLGWWGPRFVVNRDAGTGEAKRVDLSSPRRLATIYRTNLQSAYMAGRYQALDAMRKERPYWEYVAVMDDRTRPTHAAMNGKVFRADDPIWESIFPPNGYNCRCRVRALSEDDVRARGIAVTSSTGRTRNVAVESPDGVIDSRLVLDLGGGRSFSPDVGFDRNPAISPRWSDVAIADRLVTLGLAGKEVDGALAAHVTALPMVADWKGFAADAMAGNIGGPEARVLGYLSENVVTQLRRLGVEPGQLAYAIEARLLGGPKGKRAYEQSRLPMLSDMVPLPELLAREAVVLWDTEKRNLVFLVRSRDWPHLAIRVSVEIEQLRRGTTRPYLASSLGLVDPRGYGARRYDTLQGSLEDLIGAPGR